MEHCSVSPLDRRVRRLGRAELTRRLQAVQALSANRGLRFLDERAQPRTIDLALIPWLVTPVQMAFFRRVVQTMSGALLRLPKLYAQHREVRQILPFDPRQESWLRLASHPVSRPLAVLGRLDSTATFDHAAWRTAFQLLEPNTVGVGGVHYAPAACSVLLEVLSDLLEAAFPGATVTATPDPRRLLLDELARVARRLGRRVRRVALIENVDFTTGTDEFGSLAEHLCRQGVQTIVVDPRQICLSRGRLIAHGLEIDLIYRDCELSEFIEMEADGHRLPALRAAIQAGRLISGLLWEFDHKSSWEIFTDPAYARHFTPVQRRLFQRYLPWTKLVREVRVPDPRGRSVDLVRYITRSKDHLVLKPNTLYGGEGVVVGRAATQRLWEQTLTRALRGKMSYVVQQLARIATHRFPVLDHGVPREVSRCVVSGFFFNSSHVGLVGRFSADPVVNVSRGGGLLSALMIQRG